MPRAIQDFPLTNGPLSVIGEVRLTPTTGRSDGYFRGIMGVDSNKITLSLFMVSELICATFRGISQKECHRWMFMEWPQEGADAYQFVSGLGRFERFHASKISGFK